MQRHDRELGHRSLMELRCTIAVDILAKIRNRAEFKQLKVVEK